MCTCPTKFGHRGANAVGEEHLRTWHVLNAHERDSGVNLIRH